METKVNNTENKEIQKQIKSTINFAANYPMKLKMVYQNCPMLFQHRKPCLSFSFFFFYVSHLVCLFEFFDKTVRIELFAICFFCLSCEEKVMILAKIDILSEILVKT